MSSPGVNTLFGVVIFFLILTSVVVALRLWVRMGLKKSAFGWDDVFLTLTYVGFVLFVSFSAVALHYGVAASDSQPWYDPKKAQVWTNIMNDVCMIISGTVKISVALVIYRLLDYRVLLQAVIITDIAICSIFTVVTTIILSLGCTRTSISPYTFKLTTCEKTWYAQESSYVVIVVFHVVFPAALFWNVQIRNGAKFTVMVLFSLGLLSAIAVIFKLHVVIESFHSTDPNAFPDLWVRGVQWAVVEHGISLFAASVLTLRPICAPAVQRWTSFSESVSRKYTARRDSLMSRKESLSSSVSPRKSSIGSDPYRKSSLPTLKEVIATGRATTVVHKTDELKKPAWDWAQNSTLSPAAPVADMAQKARSESYDFPLSPDGVPEVNGSSPAHRDTPDYFTRASATGHRRTLTIDEHLRVLEPVYASKGGQAGLMAEPATPGRNWFDDRRWSHAAEDDFV